MPDTNHKVKMMATLLGLPEEYLLAKEQAPQSLDELQDRLGEQGQAAVERAEWGAIVRWLNNRGEAKRDPVRTKQLAQSVGYYMDAKAAQAGLPTINGMPLAAEYLAFHRSKQGRIKKAALGIKQEWQDAGREWLKVSIKYTWDYLRTAERNAQRKR